MFTISAISIFPGTYIVFDSVLGFKVKRSAPRYLDWKSPKVSVDLLVSGFKGERSIVREPLKFFFSYLL